MVTKQYILIGLLIAIIFMLWSLVDALALIMTHNFIYAIYMFTKTGIALVIVIILKFITEKFIVKKK